MSGGKEAYLVVYNAGMTILSLLSAASVVFTLLNRGLGKVWEGAGDIFLLSQGLSLLEVANAALGVSRSSPGTAFAQWVGKANVLVGILFLIPELRNTAATAVLFLAWGVSETVRFYYYLLTIVMGKGVPEQLTYVRYTLFIPLYPIGMLAELRLMWLALGTDALASLGAGYHCFTWGLARVYPLLWLPLYLHMFKQRRKKLFPKKAKGT